MVTSSSVESDNSWGTKGARLSLQSDLSVASDSLAFFFQSSSIVSQFESGKTKMCSLSTDEYWKL